MTGRSVLDKVENADEKSASERESLEEECDFCVYDDIRDKLIANGVKPEEIAYVHDAKNEQQKADLFDRVNKGEVRVLLGSTGKMGTGTNCQKKLIALHNLDIPWRPSDLQQRIGRIERQGNQNSMAHVFNYVTKGSFDAYLYQTLEAKQRFIGQIMTSKTPARTCEDVDQQALNYSEIKALCTGDERIKEKMMLDNEVKELNLLKAEHTNTVFDMQQTAATIPAKIEKAEIRLENLKADREALRQLPVDSETKLPVFKITIDGTEYTDRKEAAQAFEDVVLDFVKKSSDSEKEIGEFQEEVANMDKDKAEAEFGDVMFSLINAARLYKINPDNALELTNQKFIRRFNYLEEHTIKEGKSLKDMSLEEMDAIWNEAKKKGL